MSHDHGVNDEQNSAFQTRLRFSKVGFVSVFMYILTEKIINLKEFSNSCGQMVNSEKKSMKLILWRKVQYILTKMDYPEPLVLFFKYIPCKT